MAIGTAVDNAAETSGDLNKEAWDKYNALRVAVRVQHDDDGTHKSAGDVVLKALFDANTILYATTDDTPAALTIAASRIVGRASSGAIAALTAAQVLTILGLDADLANLTAAEVDQLKNIGTTTISATQWGALGTLVEWTAWVPTLTGDANLSGYDGARYYRLGDICFFYFRADNKNVTTAGGAIRITLPFTAANTVHIALAGFIHDGTAWVGYTLFQVVPNTNYVEVLKTAAAGGWAGTETGVDITMSGFFEIA